MKRNKLARRLAGVSVETIVGAGIACLTLGLFTLAIVSGRGDKAASIERGKRLAAQPHEAAPFGAQGSASAESDAPNTIVRNGLTVVSPPLLVPVVDLDRVDASGTDDADLGPRRAGGRRRSHYARHGYGRTRVAATRIVGLSASRRLLTVGP